jgi:hypothetical protein
MPSGFDRNGFLRDWFSEWAPEKPIYGWATELLVHLTEDEPEVAWGLILDLIERAPDDDALGWVAAGPLEDLLCHHGAELIDRVEALASADARFRRCLSGVWGHTRMDRGVYERICVAAPGERGTRERAGRGTE